MAGLDPAIHAFFAEELLFLKKKKQKDFCSCGRWHQ
jgi:hypothetical protein